MLLQEKEKDLNHMKFVFKDLEKKVDFLMQRNELLTKEVESLKLKNKLEEEVKQIKEREKRLVGIEKELKEELVVINFTSSR